MPFINGIGPGELIIILIIALIVVGPGKLPDVGAALGKSIREFRKASTEVKESVSLDQAPAAPAPVAQVAPPAPVAAPVPPVVPAEPVNVPVETASVPSATVAAPVPSATGAATGETPSGPGVPAAETAGTWPAEVTPVDEQQPTASA